MTLPAHVFWGGEGGGCPSDAFCYAGEEAKAGDRGICVYKEPGIIGFSPLEAAHGAELRILGENFSALLSENSVSLNGVPAEIISASPEELKIIVPKNKACSGLVRVTRGGKTSVSETAFSYVPTAVVSTFAGSGEAGFADGEGSKARFSWPTFVALGAAGKLYVADTQNVGIREISPTGEVILFVGENSGLIPPFGLSIDAAGNLYVAVAGKTVEAEAEYHHIQKITPRGDVSIFAGSGEPGFAEGGPTQARFHEPSGLAMDMETSTLYVADSKNHCIRALSSTGEVRTFVGICETAGHRDSKDGIPLFHSPVGIAMDAADNLYVADSWNNRIRKIILE